MYANCVHLRYFHLRLRTRNSQSRPRHVTHRTCGHSKRWSERTVLKKPLHGAQLIPRMEIQWRMGKGPVNRVTCNASIRVTRVFSCRGEEGGGWNVKEAIGERLWLVSLLFARIANFQLWIRSIFLLPINLLSAYTSGLVKRRKGKS